MSALAVLTDPVYTTPRAPSRLPRWLSRYVQDEREMPFTYLLLQMTATMQPLVGLLFVAALRGTTWWGILPATAKQQDLLLTSN
jgi:hypothetical protein